MGRNRSEHTVTQAVIDVAKPHEIAFECKRIWSDEKLEIYTKNFVLNCKAINHGR